MDLFLTMAAEDIGKSGGFCTSTANIWQIVGYILLVFKIVIPLLLIVFGIIDLGKAVIASKDDEIKKATMSLVKRAIAAVVIFLIPTIVTFIMGIVTDFSNNAEADFETCRKCISDPGSTECPADEAWTGGGSNSSSSEDE